MTAATQDANSVFGIAGLLESKQNTVMASFSVAVFFAIIVGVIQFEHVRVGYVAPALAGAFAAVGRDDFDTEVSQRRAQIGAIAHFLFFRARVSFLIPTIIGGFLFIVLRFPVLLVGGKFGAMFLAILTQIFTPLFPQTFLVGLEPTLHVFLLLGFSLRFGVHSYSYAAHYITE